MQLSRTRTAFFRAPFGFFDRDLIRRLLEASAFERIAIEPVSITTVSPSARWCATGTVTGTPARAELEQRGIPLEAVIDAAAAALAPIFGDEPCRTERRALVVTARAR